MPQAEARGPCAHAEAVPDVFDSPADRAEFRALPGHEGVELYRAHIVHHAFEPHTHDAYGIGVIDQGVERFRYRGSELLAPQHAVVLMNPDELHTGRAETPGGWRYRMVYVEPALMQRLVGARGVWFDQTVLERDAHTARVVSAVLAKLWRAHAAEPLAVDGHLAALADVLRPFAGVADKASGEAPHPMQGVLNYLEANLSQALSLGDLAQVAGLSPYHFLRKFKAQYHATPHQMLMARRLYRAKCLLANGERPADVAAAVGLVDQSHLNRSFVRRYGVTPARYRQQVGPVGVWQAGLNAH